MKTKKSKQKPKTGAKIPRDHWKEQDAPFSRLSKGEYFRMKGTKVYEYLGKVRCYDRWGTFKGWGYEYRPFDDMNDYKQTMTDKVVHIGFEF